MLYQEEHILSKESLDCGYVTKDAIKQRLAMSLISKLEYDELLMLFEFKEYDPFSVEGIQAMNSDETSEYDRNEFRSMERIDSVKIKARINLDKFKPRESSNRPVVKIIK